MCKRWRLPRKRVHRERFSAIHAADAPFGHDAQALRARLGRRGGHAPVQAAVAEVNLNHLPQEFLIVQAVLLLEDRPEGFGDDKQMFDLLLELGDL